MDNPLDASSPATPHDLLIDVQPDAPPDAMPANESQDHVRAARITSQADELLREMLAKEQYDSVCRENETLRQALRNSQQAVRDWQQELCDYKQLAETTLLQVRTALERENDTLRQALRTVQSALERENELLRSKMEPTVQPLPGLQEVQELFFAKLDKVGQEIRKDFSCKGKITLCVDEEEEGAYFIQKYRATLQACYQREIFHFDELVEQVFLPLLSKECEPWRVMPAIGGYLCILTKPEEKLKPKKTKKK